MPRCYTELMPTTRPRYTITETPELGRALDEAGKVWPELKGDRAALVRRLIEAGQLSVANNSAERIAARRSALDRAAGAVTGAYPAGAAAALKTEWPE